MLKNKKAVYILIPLNVLIWGFFVYRFYTAYADSDLPPSTTTLQVIKMENLKDSATYQLKLDYKDPFLKDVKRESTIHTNGGGRLTDQQSKKTAPPKVQVNIPPKQLPEVKYLGLIKNTSSGQTTALVSVNGQSKLIKQNESVDGIVFKSFNKDSLVAKWGKERIVARK